jgi:hypothetical protein
VDQPLNGVLQLWADPRVWWELSERSELNQPPFYARIKVARANSGKVVYSVDLPILNTMPLRFTIPTGKLPVGAYRISASAVTPATPSLPAGMALPIAWEDNVQGQPVMQKAELPLTVMAPHPTVLATTVRDASKLLTKAVEIGSPNRARYPKDDAADARARSVWDLHTYQGRLYVGCGEWTDNRGPIDIWSYDTTASQPAAWTKEFTVDDESIDIFRDYDSKLYVPGIDAREEWDYGNLYVKSGDRWQKQRTVPNGIHVLDAARFQGKLYVSTGTDSGAALFESANEGQTWTRRGDSWTEGRFYEMAPLRDFLLVMGTQAQQGAYKYQNGKLQRLLIPLLPGQEPRPYSLTQRLQPFGDGVVYTTYSYWFSRPGPAPLFFLNDFEHGAVAVQQFQNDHVQDIVVRDGKCYVLTANAKDDALEGAIYSSPDLKAWTRLAQFTVPALPKSLVLLNGTFYVGLSNRKPEAADAAAGSVWMVQE